jgi:hypothetical protein
VVPSPGQIHLAGFFVGGQPGIRLVRFTCNTPLRYGHRMNSSDDSKNIELVEKAGQSILDLLHKAADTADQNTRQAVEAAQRLAQQLQAARDRIAQLESDLAGYRDRAERSEAWLDKIRKEIEDQFPAGGHKAPM